MIKSLQTNPQFLPLISLPTINNTDFLFSLYGNYWRQLQKICTLELFSTKRVQSFRRIKEEEVSAFVRYICEHEGFIIKLSRKIFTLMNSIVARTTFGKKTENEEQILQIMAQVMKLSSGLLISNFYSSLKFIGVFTGMRARIMKVYKDGDRVFDDIILEHKEKERNNVGEDEEDLVDVFHIDNYGGKIYVDESKLHQLKYISAIIKETLRHHSHVALLVLRENSESCEISRYVISACKTNIIIKAWAIGRDSKNWNNPKMFKPKRFLDTMIDYNFKSSNFKYILFGAGRKICPRLTFAMSILKLLLSDLLYHFD